MSDVNTVGRPRVGSLKRGVSPLLATRVDEHTFHDFEKVLAATGLSQSQLLREAVDLLLIEYGSLSGRKRKTGYSDFRPVLIPENLDSLRGPTHGVVTLPTWIDWSPRKTYNLDDKFDRAAFYQVVISEARPAEMADYLDRETLIRVWPSIGLSAKIAQEWEQHFPQLKSSE
jgi:hypothetical protein